jgi:hypothetical protein
MRKTKITFCWVFNGNSIVYKTDESYYRKYLKKLYMENSSSRLKLKNKEENQIFLIKNNNKQGETKCGQ